MDIYTEIEFDTNSIQANKQGLQSAGIEIRKEIGSRSSFFIFSFRNLRRSLNPSISGICFWVGGR